MKRALLLLGAMTTFGGALRAQDDSLDKIQKDARAVFMDARKTGSVDQTRVGAVLDRCLTLATDQKGKPDGEDGAISAYMLAVQIVSGVEGEKKVARFGDIMEALVADYVNSPKMGDVVLGVLKQTEPDLSAKADEYLASIEKETTNDSVKCACAFVGVGRKLGEEPDEKASKAAVASYQDLLKKYGALDAPGKQGKWKDLLQGEIDVLTLFVIGATAPDIAGKDLDGVDFKLSEYRGKVVLIDFWGYW